MCPELPSHSSSTDKGETPISTTCALSHLNPSHNRLTLLRGGFWPAPQAHGCHKSAALCTMLEKIQIILVTSSSGPLSLLSGLGREWVLCVIQSMTALLWLAFCASHNALLYEEYFLFSL